jgi:PKD repeat protein
MSEKGRLHAIVVLLLVLLAGPAQAQYMFLDSNGDGVNDASDRIDQDGTTTLDVWVDTAADRDGSPAVCNVDPGTPLSIFSWEIVLHAIGGTIEWGPLDNMLPISPTRACFATDSDTTDPVWYHNGWGGYYHIEPGRHHLARLRVRALTGNPAIVFAPFDPRQPSDLTSFGTPCPGLEQLNTYTLGQDWRDTDGVGARFMVADAGGPYRGIASIPVAFDASGSINAAGGDLTYQWDFGDGGSATGATPTHAYAQLGEYTVSLTVTNGTLSHATWTTATIIDQAPPVARAGGPYEGYMGITLLIDGRGSSDANGDPLSYSWSFGDGTKATGAYALHTYHAPGTFTVMLTVTDGHFTSTDETTARINSANQRPPIADAGGPYSGFTGVPLRLDGTGSYDPDGNTLGYGWIFGDGQTGTGATPTHIYEAGGEYEVILEVWDGTLRTSSAAIASITDPAGSPPVVSAGGPYRSQAGETVTLQGQASDSDGDPLSFTWNLGDGSFASGAQASHAYMQPKIYTATLTATDGVYVIEGKTTVTVGAPPAGVIVARAFLDAGATSIALGTRRRPLVVRCEPVDRSFWLSDVGTELSLRCSSLNASGVIHSTSRLSGGDDSDGNGVEEFCATFDAADLMVLLGHVDRPVPVTLELEGSLLRSGQLFRAGLRVHVIPANGLFAPIVKPNPFNPQTTVTFATSRPGHVRAELFDVRGRLTKTLIGDAVMEAGGHDLAIDARGHGGEVLSSGVYFLRITSPDGTTTTRITVAK